MLIGACTLNRSNTVVTMSNYETGHDLHMWLLRLVDKFTTVLDLLVAPSTGDLNTTACVWSSGLGSIPKELELINSIPSPNPEFEQNWN